MLLVRISTNSVHANMGYSSETARRANTQTRAIRPHTKNSGLANTGKSTAYALIAYTQTRAIRPYTHE